MNLNRLSALVLLALALSVGLVACGGDDETSANGDTAAATDGGATTGAGETSGEEISLGAGEATDTAADREPPEPEVETIAVRGGAPVGGARTLEFDAGEQVRFRVRSDTAEEVHVHGYDVSKAVPAGGTVTLAFPADIEGIFEVELHGSGALIAELQVNP